MSLIKPARHLSAFLVMVMTVFALSGCGTKTLSNATGQFYSGNISQAVTTLEDDSKVPNRNKLLLYMEKGLALHETGDYKASIATLLKASELIKEQDIISLSKQTASLVTSDWVTEYKGEYSERLWVHTYLMMNFLLTGQYEGALVEAKQALAVYDAFPEALVNDYFTRALIALCFESLGEYNGAYVEYKKLAEASGNSALVAPELYRLAQKLGFADDARQYKTKISDAYLAHLKKNGSAELVVFVGTGRIPRKVSGDIVVPPAHRFSFPRYTDIPSGMMTLTPFDGEKNLPSVSIVTNMGKVADNALSDRRAKVMVKETARVAAKEAIAHQLDDNGDGLGALLRIVFFALEEADVRCWQTLPLNLGYVRIPLAPGTHRVQVDVAKKGRYHKIILPEVDLKKGEKAFFSVRLNENFSIMSSFP